MLQNGYIRKVSRISTSEEDVLQCFIVEHCKTPDAILLYKFCNLGDAYVDYIKVLLDAGEDPQRPKDGYGTSDVNPFVIACRRGFTEIYQSMLPYVNINRIGDGVEYYMTPLSYASAGGHIDIIESLLSLGAKVDPIIDFDYKPLSKAIDNHHIDAVNILCQNGAKIDGQIYRACLSGIVAIYDILLLYGANVYELDENEQSCLTMATLSGNAEMVERVINMKVDINQQIIEGDTALHYACKHKYEEIIDILLKAGAGPNIQNDNGEVSLKIMLVTNP